MQVNQDYKAQGDMIEEGIDIADQWLQHNLPPLDEKDHIIDALSKCIALITHRDKPKH